MNVEKNDLGKSKAVCPNCGELTELTAQGICPDCADAYDKFEFSDKKACPFCGAMNPADSNLCLHCCSILKRED